jgi:hypothetical protein
VTDARTGRPIAGANVRAESFQVPTPPGYGTRGTLVGSLEVNTDTLGRWEIPSDAKWTIGILAADGMPLFVEVHCVFAAGYQPALRNPHKAWLDPAVAPGQGVSTDHEIEANVELEPLVSPSSKATVRGQTRCGVPL